MAEIFPGGAALTGATGDGRPDKALARNPGGFLMGGDIPRWRCADRGYRGDGCPDKALARNPGEGAGSGEVLLGLRFFAAVQRQ
jgi:hypothetical protein